ncbi:MAG: hypothetical protein AAF384_03795 [Pseudomonadota bacterium]
MNEPILAFSNPIGEFLAPVLLMIQRTGFFEAYVFIPVMTAGALLVFVAVKKRVIANLVPVENSVVRLTLLGVYLMLCFLAMNSTAVAFKTLLISELDYTQLHWFVPYVSPLHFYISSVAIAHLYLVAGDPRRSTKLFLCGYIQVALIGGYAIAAHRLMYEPFVLTDVTTGLGAIFMLGWFSLWNWDVVRQFTRQATERGTTWRYFFSTRRRYPITALHSTLHRSKSRETTPLYDVKV